MKALGLEDPEKYLFTLCYADQDGSEMQSLATQQYCHQGNLRGCSLALLEIFSGAGWRKIEAAGDVRRKKYKYCDDSCFSRYRPNACRRSRPRKRLLSLYVLRQDKGFSACRHPVAGNI